MGNAVENKKMLIFVHGYGASGNDLLPVSHSLKVNSFIFLAPDAPKICEENPFGFQWFSLVDRSAVAIRKGLDYARPILGQYIKEQTTKYCIPLSHCFVFGFSQGAMLCLDLIYELEKIGGLIAYAGSFSLAHHKILLPKATPILMIHGTKDMVVPYAHLKTSQTSLNALGFLPQILSLKGVEHTITDEGLIATSEFLNKN